MGHIGQEVGLVLAGLFQLAGLQRQGGGAALQVIALCRQHLRLFFQLAVGLFQLGLLLFEAGLGFLERPTLFFQLFIGDAQFLALDLKLFGLTLGFLQHILQLGAIAGRTQGGADGGADFFEQDRQLLVRSVQEAQFQHPVDGAVRLGRRDDQMPGFIAAKGRSYGQIAVRHVGYAQSLAIRRDLTQQAFAQAETIRNRRVGRNAQGGDAAILAAFALEKRGRLNPCVAAEIGKNAVAQLFKGLIAHHGFRQAHLSLVQPFLARTSARAVSDQIEDYDRQGGAQHSRQETASQRCPIGGAHRDYALFAHTLLVGAHQTDLGANRVHDALAFVGAHPRQSRLYPRCSSGLKGRVQFGHLGVEKAT